MTDKLKSRKFIVWITSTIFLVLGIVGYYITRDSGMTEVLKIFAESWGWISAVYIGGNVAQKCLCKETEQQ